MPKHYLILSSQVTAGMRSLSEHEATLTYLQVPGTNEASMDSLLSSVNDDNWVKAPSVVLEDGSVSGILLPKEAGKK